MRLVKGYKFRLYPTLEQKQYLEKVFGSVRWVWNWGLSLKQEKYKQDKSSLYYNQISAQLTQKKKEEDFIWLKEPNSHSLQQSLMDLEKSFLSFFKNQSKYPKYKSKRNKQSFRLPDCFKLAENKLKIPKLSPIKIVQHREFGPNAKLLNVTISKNKANQYFASFNVEEDKVVKAKPTANKIGIDLGLDNLMTLSNGSKIKNPRIAQRYRSKLTHQQRQYSKKQPKSNNKEKARVSLARTYQKISNIKQDYIHKLTSRIINENQVIVMEDLNITGMMKNHRLARSIQDVSWYEIIRQLQYKADWSNRELIQVNPFFPSSKLCKDCGWINQNLTLKNRTWACKCGSIHDRDINAAINILNSGCRQQPEVKQKQGEALRRVSEKSERDIKSMNLEKFSERRI